MRSQTDYTTIPLQIATGTCKLQIRDRIPQPCLVARIRHDVGFVQMVSGHATDGNVVLIEMSEGDSVVAALVKVLESEG